MQIIDLTTGAEHPITLAAAAEFLPRNDEGSKISIRTIERWIRHGHRGVHLGAAKLGGAFYTTREAIQRFNVACMSADQKKGAAAVAPPVQPKTASKTPARRELERRGWTGSKPKNGRAKAPVA